MRMVQMTLDDELVGAVDKVVKELKDDPLLFHSQGLAGCDRKIPCSPAGGATSERICPPSCQEERIQRVGKGTEVGG